MELGWRVVLRPEQTLLTFGADPDKRKGPEYFSLTMLFSYINGWILMKKIRLI